MNYFYLTTNTLRREPEAIASVEYCHIKAKTDGSQTVILTEEEINAENVTLLSQEEAQALLDSWIDTENETAPLDELWEKNRLKAEDLLEDDERVPDPQKFLLQSKIDLNKYL